MEAPEYPEGFGARVYKISRDASGIRLTHMKITGGSLKVKESVTNRKPDMDEKPGGEMNVWEEKVNQIRIYSGEKYETVQEASAGMVCAVTGLSLTYPGEGLGEEVCCACAGTGAELPGHPAGGDGYPYDAFEPAQAGRGRPYAPYPVE